MTFDTRVEARGTRKDDRIVLFKKVNKITELMQREGGNVSFADLSRTLADTMGECEVYVISRKGKVLGHSLKDGFPSTPFDPEWVENRRVSDELSSGLLKVGALSTDTEAERVVGFGPSLIAPAVSSGRRVGTLLAVTTGRPFVEDDWVLAEYAATIVGMVIAQAIDEEEEDEAAGKRMARSAINSLSYSEIRAMQHIFDELEGDEGVLVASRIADQAGITRSVVVNALRKLASADVIESRSLGMKGTYLRILNSEVRKELDRQRYPYMRSPELLRRRA